MQAFRRYAAFAPVAPPPGTAQPQLRLHVHNGMVFLPPSRFFGAIRAEAQLGLRGPRGLPTGQDLKHREMKARN